LSKTEVVTPVLSTQTSAPKKGLFAMLAQAKAETKPAAPTVASKSEETLGLLNFKPAQKAIVGPVAARLIEQANTKLPLESQHALTLLHSTIDDPLARVDLLSYSTIYFYSVNSDSSSLNIPLRQRNVHLSREQRKSLFLPGDHLAYRFEILPRSFLAIDQSDTLRYPFITFCALDHNTKQRCLVFQVTDPKCDRELIDKIEMKHREKGDEVFYILKHRDVGFKKRDITRRTYVDLIVKEAEEAALKAEKIETKEAMYKQVILTLVA